MKTLLSRFLTWMLAPGIYILTSIPALGQGTPLVKVTSESTTSVSNGGSLPITFTRSTTIPTVTTNVAPNAGAGESAFDFGTTTGNYYVQSTVPLDGLKSLSAFTLTGWLNAKSLTAGSGGNRIISWINNGGDGVDLVLQNNGSMRLGVDAWPDASPAVSSAGKVTANASAAAANWVFFAVTYQSNGQVNFYFGNTANNAVLDVSRSYVAPGVTGSNIGKLAIGAFNDATRNSGTYDRMFRGVVDDVRVYGSALSATDIVNVQRAGTTDTTNPTPPSNLRATVVNDNTAINLMWDAGSDNVGVVGYEIFDDVEWLATVGNVTSHTLTDVNRNKTYKFMVRARDAAGNFSTFSAPSLVNITGLVSGYPLVSLSFDDMVNGPPTSSGTVAGLTFTTGTAPSGATLPGVSLETPPFVGGNLSVDYGTTPTNAFVESQNPINELKNLSSFTITGWLNCKSNTAGSGGNRIVSWINNGGEGVDLVYQNNGSLRLGVDGWPDSSPAFSNAGKVTTDPSGQQNNWVFFAVTYQSNGQVQYYFGTNTAKATLDATRNYPGPGVTGSNIGKLAIGAFNSATRNAGTYDRMFRGVIDDVKVFGSVLPLTDIIKVQGKNLTDVTPPTVPGNLMVTGKSVSTISLSWTPSTDNVGLDVTHGYKLFNNGNIIANVNEYNSFVLTGLAPSTSYNLTLKAVDGAGNLSAASNLVTATTDATGVPIPIIDTKFEEVTGSYALSEGIHSYSLTRTPETPASSTNVPNVPNDLRSVDFGTTPGNFAISSNYLIGDLANLSSFTLTGWVNTRSNTTGTGGNRIMSWTNNGGDGVDLVYQSNGSLRLGVDQLADASPAVSSIGKITTDPNAGASNWVFFAVTYQSAGQVQFYFGNNATDASLDATVNYTGRGAVGSVIGDLAFGAFNDASRTDANYANMFRGLIDNFKIHGSVLSLTDIRSVQRGIYSDVTAPTAPTNLTASENTGTSVWLNWTESTDNVGVVAYNIYNGTTLIATTQGLYGSQILSGLTPGQNYQFNIKARDAAGNLSPAGIINVYTPPVPLIYLPFSYEPSSMMPNRGSIGGSFLALETSTNTPNGGGAFALAGAATKLNAEDISDELKSLSAFTVMGWVNRTSASGGDRIVGWMPTGGGDGAELLLQADGRLRLGVDGVAESSPAVSSAGKVTVDASASPNNWTFFAVTYQANGQTQFYFGNNNVSASLDVTVNYPGPGTTGANISSFYLNAPAGGIMDEVRVFNSALSLQDIRSFQYGPEDNIAPTSPGLLTTTNVTSTSIALHWSELSTDNIGVTSYDIFNGSTIVAREVVYPKGYDYQDHTVVGLTPGTTYNLYVKARDSRGNYSAPTNTVTVTTSDVSPIPLVWLKLDENTGTVAGNSGSSAASFVRSSGVPAASDNVPTGISSVKSADYGTSSANAYIESTTSVTDLKGLTGFTITGWVNNRSNVMGSGGNRIVSWINNGGEGVDLVYKNNGSLQLGVDQWPDSSPATSSANKVTTNGSAPGSNWVFFAVTYTQAGTVEFYFGTTSIVAYLDVAIGYPGRGAVGTNTGKLAIGNFNDATRNNLPAFDRVFRGMIDDIRVFGSVLSKQQIIDIQGFGGVGDARLAMTPEPLIQDETIDEPALTQNYPNPFASGTNIEVNIPHSVRVAKLTIADLTGRTMQNIDIEGRGPTSVAVSSDGMNSGVYIYTLLTDGKVVGYKRMMVRK
ncbi:LamG-like jellyroll fold domain-containing protein [Chryseolinea sp. T2]|uniref:LamG-like jellyroll fold domain-containing protein n=1 Tax=Chryseolinea sp. T2 TaxID=3129255 RepID=UPI00307812BD